MSGKLAAMYACLHVLVETCYDFALQEGRDVLCESIMNNSIECVKFILRQPKYQHGFQNEVFLVACSCDHFDLQIGAERSISTAFCCPNRKHRDVFKLNGRKISTSPTR